MRTFTVAIDEPSKPKREYTGFDRDIDYPNKIAIVRSGVIDTPGIDDVFALDYCPDDPSIYKNACKELVRYCTDNSDSYRITGIIGFYDWSPMVFHKHNLNGAHWFQRYS